MSNVFTYRTFGNGDTVVYNKGVIDFTIPATRQTKVHAIMVGNVSARKVGA